METVLLSVEKGIFTTKFIKILATNQKVNVQTKVRIRHLTKEKMVLSPRIKITFKSKKKKKNHEFVMEKHILFDNK